MRTRRAGSCGSAAVATTYRDDVWDELVLDSGSVSTACSHAWCSDTGLNDKEKAYLQDIQHRRIPSRGSRVVPPEPWGPEGNIQCKVKFDGRRGVPGGLTRENDRVGLHVQCR